LNTEQIRALNRQTTVIIVPGGVLEEHGPYLPSYTDGYANERLTEVLAAAIAARSGWTAVVFPAIPLGSGGANVIGAKYSFPGSYGVRPAVLRAIFMDLATEFGEQGFRWIFVVHGHGGPQNRVLDEAGDYFRDTYGGHMVHLMGLRPAKMAWDSVIQAEVPSTARVEDGFTVHAGLAEHSAIMAAPPRSRPRVDRAGAIRHRGKLFPPPAHCCPSGLAWLLRCTASCERRAGTTLDRSGTPAVRGSRAAHSRRTRRTSDPSARGDQRSEPRARNGVCEPPHCMTLSRMRDSERGLPGEGSASGGSGLRSRGRAPMLVGGWRGRSAVGISVRIAGGADFERFRRAWCCHHPLDTNGDRWDGVTRAPGAPVPEPSTISSRSRSG
jgi:creatinine amidohydrolase/Fe(II)-dependent formamide hydrolase-like protein